MAPAQLLREARTTARLSQTELARRSGVAQSVISAYENGRRRPSLHILERLVAATGNRLLLAYEPAEPPEDASTDLARRVRERRDQVLAATGRHGVTNVRLFGSVARGEDGPDSDVDLLVDVPPGMSLFTLVELEAELTEILGAPVDLVPSVGLKERVRAGAEREARPL